MQPSPLGKIFFICTSEGLCVPWGQIRGGGRSLSGEEMHPREREQHVQWGRALRWPSIWKTQSAFGLGGTDTVYCMADTGKVAGSSREAEAAGHARVLCASGSQDHVPYPRGWNSQ